MEAGVPVAGRHQDEPENERRPYGVDLAFDEEELLDWDKTLSQQAAKVREARNKLGIAEAERQDLKLEIGAETRTEHGSTRWAVTDQRGLEGAHIEQWPDGDVAWSLPGDDRNFPGHGGAATAVLLLDRSCRWRALKKSSPPETSHNSRPKTQQPCDRRRTAAT
jgi:hypothetical protein